MKRSLVSVVLLTSILYSWSANITVPDSTIQGSNNYVLNEIVVRAPYLSREADHIVALPTKEQRRHAISGYDLLRNLMIPGLDVNRSNGTVTSPAGTATLYIDGREATFREIQSIRPKDIAKVEYYDLPSGKYANDAAAINIVMKEVTAGGYTQLDAMQGVGFLNGEYNLISKYITGTKSINLWAGYSLENPHSSLAQTERFAFPTPIERQTSYEHSGNREEEEYVQASISNRGKSMIWMIRGGVAWNQERHTIAHGSVNYGINSSIQPSIMSLRSKDRSLRPSLYFYGSNTLSQTLSLDYVVDGYYSRNHHDRDYMEQSQNFVNDVAEDYYYLKLNANLVKTLKHGNRLSFILYEFLRNSQSEYGSVNPYSQDLLSSETILFADYSQRVGRFFYDINPGISFLNYRLKGMKSIRHFTPRLQLRAAYAVRKGQQLQFAFALGNTYPRINTINDVEQRLDPIIVLRGNPKMDNSILLSPRLSYFMNVNKLTLQAGVSYYYQNHAIVSDYLVEGDNLISTFRDDAVYHKPSADISVSYKPTGHFNLNLSGAWERHIVTGTAPHHRLTSWTGSAEINYYVGDFAFGASLRTPTRNMIDYQINRKIDWRYQLSAMWNRGNWAVEVNANNLFLMKNRTIDELRTLAYSYRSNNWNRSFNQYATFKVAYSFSYGKKTNKTPSYEHKSSESAILK